MKKLFLVAGIITASLGLLQCGKYLWDYHALTQFGKGYVWGSVLLLAIGTILIITGLTKNKTLVRNKD